MMSRIRTHNVNGDRHLLVKDNSTLEDKNTTDTYLNCMINVSITTSGPLIMMKRTHSFVMPVASVNMPSLTTL
jgi:hypothetical protein